MGSCTPDKNGKLKTDKKRACRLLLFFYQCQSSLFLSTFLFFLSTFLFFLPVLVFHFLSTLDFLMFSTSVRLTKTRLPHVFYQCQVDKNSTSSCFLPGYSSLFCQHSTSPFIISINVLITCGVFVHWTKSTLVKEKYRHKEN